MKMTTAIFDLDGTLLNTLGDLCDSVTYAVEKHGFPPVSMEQTRIRIGNGVRKLVERSIPEESRTDEMIDTCLADFRAFYGEHMMNRTHPYEGIVSVLETLKENGVTVGVLSNKYDSAAKALIEHYFGDLVCITYGERPNIPRKPDPTSVLQLLDELGGLEETRALEQGFFSGVDFIASLHAPDAAQAQCRPQVQALLQRGMLRQLVVLAGRETPGCIREVCAV